MILISDRDPRWRLAAGDEADLVRPCADDDGAHDRDRRIAAVVASIFVTASARRLRGTR